MDFYGFYDLNDEDNFVQSFIGGESSVFGRSYEEPELARPHHHHNNNYNHSLSGNNNNHNNNSNNQGHGTTGHFSSFQQRSTESAMTVDRSTRTGTNSHVEGRSVSSTDSWESSSLSSKGSPTTGDEETYLPHQSTSSVGGGSNVGGIFSSLESFIPMSVVEHHDHELSFFETSMPSAALGRLQLPPPAPTSYFHSPNDEGEADVDAEELSCELEEKLANFESLDGGHRRKRKSIGSKFRTKSTTSCKEVDGGIGAPLTLQVPLPPLGKGKQQNFRFDSNVVPPFQEAQSLELKPKMKQEYPLAPIKLESNNNPSAVELIVERQPPVEVRTRTPSENRNFGVTVRIGGDFERLNLESIEVRLAYAACDDQVKQAILGGRKVVTVKEDGRAVFDNLSMREASTKHGEKEFCLEFLPLTRDGKALGNFGVRTNPFYAYSHMKVLTRRKCVKLRTLNKSYGTARGGEKMHVIGQPFIRGPSLSIVFSTPHGDVYAPHAELYSDSVLFFELPPYPDASVFSPFNAQRITEIKVKVQVTNDGRAFSNALDFTYLADSALHPMDFRG